MRRFLLILMLVSCLPTLAVAEEPPTTVFEGPWRFEMKNKNHRKNVTLYLETKGKRIEGHIYDEQRSNPDIEGKLRKNKFIVWSRMVDGLGRSTEATFRGKLKDGVITGKADYWGKRYDFEARPVPPKGG